MEKEPNFEKRYAARTVIVDDRGRFAILEVGGGDYYKIPGGGLEEGESEEQAAKREALEEAGCEVEILRDLGRHEFIDSDPQYGDVSHGSVCYLARKVGDSHDTNFDAEEKQRGFKLHWMTYEEALEKFRNANPAGFFGKEINKRDMAFLVSAKAMLDKDPK